MTATESATSTVRSDLPSLTGLRWVAAFLVFGYHLHVVEYFAPGTVRSLLGAVFGQGSVGVSFFFVLSGFVLMWSSARTPARRFWYRRFARVYPLHGVTAVIAFVFLAGWKPQESPTLATGLANLALLQSWVPDESFYQGLNTVSWTLSCEAFFYFGFPLFAARIGRLGGGGALRLAGVAFAVTVMGPILTGLVFPREGVEWFWHWTPVGRFAEFLLGVALACVVRLGRERLRHHCTSLWWAAGVLTVAGYVASAHGPHVLRIAAFTMLGFGLVLVAAAVSDLRGRSLIWAHPVFVRLGEVSFAFYLIHLLVIRALELVFGYHPRLDTGRAVALTALTFTVSLTLAWLLHVGVERPARRLLISAGPSR